MCAEMSMSEPKQICTGPLTSAWIGEHGVNAVGEAERRGTVPDLSLSLCTEEKC